MTHGCDIRTASIVGHETRHAEDIERQTDESLVNLAAVIDMAGRTVGNRTLGDLAGIRAYVRQADHASPVIRQIRSQVRGVPVTVVHAALCRDDLLVELEAQMAL